MNVRSWLIHLYPRPWRERYGDEFDALLEECLHSPLDALDIFLGALDAHLELTNEMNWRLMNMTNKLRTTILIVFASYIAFIVAGMSLYGFADDSPFIPMMKTNLALYASWRTIQIGSVIALLSVVIGGAPLACSIRGLLRVQHANLESAFCIHSSRINVGIDRHLYPRRDCQHCGCVEGDLPYGCGAGNLPYTWKANYHQAL